MLGNFDEFLSFADFFSKLIYSKISSGMPTECQTVWIRIRGNVLLDLIWVQTVCKDYQPMTQVGKELKIWVNTSS